MRAFHWRVVTALTPIVVAIAACADETVSGLGGVVTLTSRGSTNVAKVTRTANDSGFGSSVVRGGVTGVTVTRATATVAPSAPPIFRTSLNLTINGKSPGEWHDRRLVDAQKPAYIYLVPELNDQSSVPLSAQVTQNSRTDFSTVKQGTYHLVYSDGNLPSNPETDAQGYKRLDMLGFFVTNAMSFRGSTSASSTIDLDLFWDSMASPNSSDGRAGDDAHALGQYTTYKDKFRTKPFKNAYISSLPLNQQECTYRFVVKNADGIGNVVWQSQWHRLEPDKDPDFINVAWNGYSSRTSGPKDAPPEDDPNNRLAEQQYLFCIEFYSLYGRPPVGDFRQIIAQGQNFISTFYGASQWYSFSLKHGVKPSPAPGSSPSPSPVPSTSPTSQPAVTPSPNQISL